MDAVQGTLSRLYDLDCGVPEGSCLGPLLYVICVSKLFNIIEGHLHCYADDSQLYLSFRPADGLSSQTDAIQAMERCIEDIRHWMVSNRLLLNDEKTEFLLIGTRQPMSKVEPPPLRVGKMDIEPMNCVGHFGAWFDSMLSMETLTKYAVLDFIICITSEGLESTYTRLFSNSYPCICHRSAGLF